MKITKNKQGKYLKLLKKERKPNKKKNFKIKHQLDPFIDIFLNESLKQNAEKENLKRKTLIKKLEIPKIQKNPIK